MSRKSRSWLLPGWSGQLGLLGRWRHSWLLRLLLLLLRGHSRNWLGRGLREGFTTDAWGWRVAQRGATLSGCRRHLVPGLLLALLMGRIRRLLLLLRSRPGRIPVGRLRIATGATPRVPLVRCPRRSSRRNTTGTSGRSGWPGWTVVRAPLAGLRALGTLGRVLTAVLALTLPSAGIHWSLLVGRVRLLVLLKVGMPSRLVWLISVVIRLRRLRWRSGITSLPSLGPRRSRSDARLSRGTGSSGSTTRSTGWPLTTLASNGPSGWSCGWRLGRTLALARWRLLLVGSLLGRWRIRTTCVASAAVRVGTGTGWGRTWRGWSRSAFAGLRRSVRRIHRSTTGRVLSLLARLRILPGGASRPPVLVRSTILIGSGLALVGGTLWPS